MAFALPEITWYTLGTYLVCIQFLIPPGYRLSVEG